MAISTYDELISAVISFSHREDIDTLIPNFIYLAETEFFANPQEVLETRPIEVNATATALGPPSASRFVGLPDGYLSNRDLRITYLGREYPLSFDVPGALVVRPGDGLPCRYTITNQIELDILPDQDYTLTQKYFARMQPLTDVNQTNEVLTSDPNIYLYGVLHQLFTWSEDDNESVKYFNKFIGAIKGANKRARKGRIGHGQRMKLRSFTP